VPDHELLVRIGGGSYGDVWLARSVVGTWRAVKVVFRDRFLDSRPYEREFSGIQKFEPLSRSNEGFIDILQIGRNDAEGYFYYVMELADDASGAPEIRPETYLPKTLAKALLQRGRLAVSDCLELGITLNLALTRLHEAGLIHRDIKPSNIIFVGGVPKLADIGLVIEVVEARSYVGTEGFIPPEGPNSPQADLYSLGKVLYEAGMGKDRKDFPEPLTQIAELPDSTELLEFNAILLKACAANVKDRYRSAGEMNADLALLQSGGSVRRQRTLTRRLRTVQRAGVLVTALTVIIGAGWFWQAKQTRIVRELAVRNRQIADEKSRLAAEKSSLAEEHREQLVRLRIANGIRLLDQEDPSGALLWFAEALPLVTNKPAEESIHRIRIQQTFYQVPRLLHVLAHDSSVTASAFSPDGRRLATGTLDGRLRVWDAETATLLGSPHDLGLLILQVRFTSDGRRLLISSSPPQECAARGRPPANFAAVLDAESGHEIFPRLSSNVVWSTFSPNGQWLAVAMSDNVIRLFDTKDGRLVTELKGHTNEITVFSFADENLLVSASLDGTARLWRLPSGEPQGPPLYHEKPVNRAMLSPDGRHLVTGTKANTAFEDCVIQVWDPASGRKLGAPVTTERASVDGLFFDRRSGNLLFTSGRFGEVRVWNPDILTNRQPVMKMKGNLNCSTFSPDGARLAAGIDNAAIIWDIYADEFPFPPFRHTGVMSIRFSPDGTRLLTCGSDGTGKLWALDSRPEAASTRIDAPMVSKYRPQSYFVDRDVGRQPGPIPIFANDGSVRLLDPKTLAEVHRLVPAKTNAPTNRCVIAASGRRWGVFHWEDHPTQDPQDSFGDSTSAKSDRVDLWHERDGSLVHFELTNPPGVQAVAFSPDESRLLVAVKSGRILFWKTEDGTLDRELSLPYPFVQVWAFSPDAGRALLIPRRHTATNLNDVLEVFDLRDVRLLSPPFESPVGEDFGFDPAGNRLATVGQDEFVRIFDVRTGQLVCPPFKQPGAMLSLDWSPDGRQLLAAGTEGEVMISDAATGEQYLAPLATGAKPAVLSRWSPDGRFIVTRNDDLCVRVWDAKTTEGVTPLLRHRGYIRFACITPDNRLITASDPDLVRAWEIKETHLAPDILMDYAKLVSGRRLNAAGVLLSLKPDELAALSRSLHTRAPQLFE
jgi:WD40 repeat protein/serine/threonine protein kinase